uniref:Uncharacterized protein n=1 Tax=Solanum lycopersicum TaxID=4081 RepID=A0A3Q7FCR0_SOLLC
MAKTMMMNSFFKIAAPSNIGFHGTSYFALCATDSVMPYKPFMNISSDSDAFVIPNLPHQIKLTRTQLAPFD